MPAWSGGGVQINGLASSWGSLGMSYCLPHNAGDACVGNSLSGCANWINRTKSDNRGTEDDDMAILMLIARQVNENGAYFCVTQAQGTNKNKDAWTTYHNPAGGVSKCFWLCKPGHSGDGCAAGVATTCDATPILRKDFEEYKIATNDAPNIEDDIPMFHWNHYRKCNGAEKRKEEHDMILAISAWVPSGHGAFAQPTVVRAERGSWIGDDLMSTATIYFVGTATLLCKTGYQPNVAGDDCVPIDEIKCNETSLCSGWNGGGFNREIHSMHEKNGCYEYRCSAVGTAFASATDHKCIECTGDRRVGIPTDTGVCVRCPTGKIFSESAAATGYCVDATSYSVDALAFGVGKNRNTKLADQCWTKLEPSEYRECVTGK